MGLVWVRTENQKIEANKIEKNQAKSPDFTGNQEIFGASGDIGFIPKASNINGLRAIEQQYLRQKPNVSFGF